MTEPLRGMILAAGHGARLAPLTDRVPKPLLPVNGVVLLDHVIAACDRAGVGPIAVNTHHLGRQIATHLQARTDAERFTVLPESDILGTGGALRGARGFLSQGDTFLLHNGDVLCDADLPALLADHRRSGALATLLLISWPAVDSVLLAPDGCIVKLAGMPAGAVEPVGARRMTYAGVGAFDCRLLTEIGPGFSSLVDHLAAALQRDPHSVRGWAPPEVRWSDVGTLGRWLAAQTSARPEAAATAFTLTRLTGHGSDRRFWRIAAGDWSAVAMANPADDGEFDRFLQVDRFLADMGLAPPAITAVDEEGRAVLLEDLGERRLHDLGLDSGAAEPLATAYHQAVDWLLDLQTATPQALAECPAAVDRSLDRAALRWETAYFAERFLRGHLGCDASALAPLDDEFASLARCVIAQPQYLLHRDFQSQNLLLKAGRLRPVDFQGMRLGPMTYDLASLVWDPYLALRPALRADLVARFVAAAQTRRLAPADAGPASLAGMVLASALQRLMQALGAFGFLGHVKGKRAFLGHVPRGLNHLRQVLSLGEEARDGAEASVRRWLPPAMPHLTAVLRQHSDGRA